MLTRISSAPSDWALRRGSQCSPVRVTDEQGAIFVPVPKGRRIFRFSLASLLILISVCGIWMGWRANRVRHQQRVVAAIGEIGGQVNFSEGSAADRWAPTWLRDWLGEDYFRRVTGIDLQGCEASDELVADIARLRDVQHLSLTQTKITDQALHHLARLTKLKALSLGFNGITNASLEQLAPLDELIFLDLDVTEVTDDGLPALNELAKLYHLKLYGNPITDRGAEVLSGIPTLGELDLGNTEITDEGIKHLAKLPILNRLRLDQMITGQGQELRITDKSLPYIMQMSKLIDLAMVSLAVTDEGIQQLSAHPTLRYLNVFGCDLVTDAGIDVLQRENSSITIRH